LQVHLKFNTNIYCQHRPSSQGQDRRVHERHRATTLALCDAGLRARLGCFLACVAAVATAHAFPARPLSFSVPSVDHQPAMPPSRTPTHRCTGSVKPFRRVRLANTPKATPFLFARSAWYCLAVCRSGLPHALRTRSVPVVDG
jgi:hypothetical protein